MREMKAGVGSVGAGLKLSVVEWSLVANIFADNTVLFAESEKKLQKIVAGFYGVCKRRN